MNENPFEIAIKELEAGTEDIRPSDVVSFSEPLRSALNYVIRLGRFSLTEFQEKLEFTREETKKSRIFLWREICLQFQDSRMPKRLFTNLDSPQ